MSRWRWGLFRVSQFVASGLIRTTRTLAYASAGVLTREELGRAAAGRWGDFGMNEPYVLSGLFTWEQNFYFRHLKPEDRVLLIGAGSGRDLIGLRRAGFCVDGLEPSARAAALGREMLIKAGVEGTISVGSVQDEMDGKYDAFIFSWYCYSYIPERATRVAALQRLRDHLLPGGRLLLSYVVAEPVPRWLPRAVAASTARLTRSGWTPEAMDFFSFETGGLHFEHQFVPGEMEEEAAEAELKVLAHTCGDDGFIALTAEG